MISALSRYIRGIGERSRFGRQNIHLMSQHIRIIDVMTHFLTLGVFDVMTNCCRHDVILASSHNL